MGSFITIGLVYNELDLERIEVELRSLTRFLLSREGYFKSMKVSRDISGDEWIEHSLLSGYQIGNLCSLLAKYHYGQVSISCKLLGETHLDVTVRIHKEEDYFGFLLEVAEADLISARHREELDALTERIIYLIIDMHSFLSYHYAFCDNEAEVRYSPEVFGTLANDVYSVVVMPSGVDEKPYSVVKSSWHIDGLTRRE